MIMPAQKIDRLFCSLPSVKLHFVASPSNNVMVSWLKSLLDLVQHEQLLVGPPSNSTEIVWSSISVFIRTALTSM